MATINFRGFVGLTKDARGHYQNRGSAARLPRGKCDIQLEGDAAMWYVAVQGGLSQTGREPAKHAEGHPGKGTSVEWSRSLRFTQFISNAAKRVHVDNKRPTPAAVTRYRSSKWRHPAARDPWKMSESL